VVLDRNTGCQHHRADPVLEILPADTLVGDTGQAAFTDGEALEKLDVVRAGGELGGRELADLDSSPDRGDRAKRRMSEVQVEVKIVARARNAQESEQSASPSTLPSLPVSPPADNKAIPPPGGLVNIWPIEWSNACGYLGV